MKIKKGVKLIDEEAGSGEGVKRQKNYVVAIRLTLNQGDVVAVPNRCLSHFMNGSIKHYANGYFEHCVRIDRENLIAGLFYTVEGMKVGGYRKVIISPHLGYGEKGIPDVIPENAKLIAEVRILRAHQSDSGLPVRKVNPERSVLVS